MTADELWALHDNGMRHELVEGELRTMSPAGGPHGYITVELTEPLARFVREHDLGVVFGAETGFRIARDPDTVRAPDIAFVRRDRIPATGIPEGFWPGAPDLAVEVVSPSDTADEIDEKVHQWLTSGTRLVWVVKPRRKTITVYRTPTTPVVLTDTDTLDGEDVVPGFHLRVGDLFRF